MFTFEKNKIQQMAKDFWVNLPVKNIEKSRAFFKELGFTFNEKHGNSANSAALLIGEKKYCCDAI